MRLVVRRALVDNPGHRVGRPGCVSCLRGRVPEASAAAETAVVVVVVVMVVVVLVVVAVVAVVCSTCRTLVLVLVVLCRTCRVVPEARSSTSTATHPCASARAASSCGVNIRVRDVGGEEV